MTPRTVRTACPRCNRKQRDTALAVTTDERGTVSYCHRCGYTSVNNRDAPVLQSQLRIVPPKQPPLEWSGRAAYIWRRTQPLHGSVGETYLLHRRCVLPPANSHLRFLPGNDRFPPSLCAAVTDVWTGRPLSLHFTRLADDGHGKAGGSADKLLLSGHRKKNACVRLWRDDAVTTGLALAEGIESALAIAHGYTPVWATIDCANLASGIPCTARNRVHPDRGGSRHSRH